MTGNTTRTSVIETPQNVLNAYEQFTLALQSASIAIEIEANAPEKARSANQRVLEYSEDLVGEILSSGLPELTKAAWLIAIRMGRSDPIEATQSDAIDVIGRAQDITDHLEQINEQLLAPGVPVLSIDGNFYLSPAVAITEKVPEGDDGLALQPLINPDNGWVHFKIGQTPFGLSAVGVLEAVYGKAAMTEEKFSEVIGRYSRARPSGQGSYDGDTVLIGIGSISEFLRQDTLAQASSPVGRHFGETERKKIYVKLRKLGVELEPIAEIEEWVEKLRTEITERYANQLLRAIRASAERGDKTRDEGWDKLMEPTDDEVLLGVSHEGIRQAAVAANQTYRDFIESTL